MFKASAFIRRLSNNYPSPRHVSHLLKVASSSLATCMFGSRLGNTCPTKFNKNTHPATQNRIRDHLIAAEIYNHMLYQLSYSRSCTHNVSEILPIVQPGEMRVDTMCTTQH